MDFGAGEVVPTTSVLEGLLEWTAPARAALGLEVEVPPEDGATRARRALAVGATIADVYRDVVAETARSYAPELARS
jgi:hypothetical protein